MKSLTPDELQALPVGTEIFTFKNVSSDSITIYGYHLAPCLTNIQFDEYCPIKPGLKVETLQFNYFENLDRMKSEKQHLGSIKLVSNTTRTRNHSNRHQKYIITDFSKEYNVFLTEREARVALMENILLYKSSVERLLTRVNKQYQGFLDTGYMKEHVESFPEDFV